MYDIIILGAGISGSVFGYFTSKIAKCLILEANESIDVKTNIFPEHNNPYIENIGLDNKEIFPYDHVITNYLGKEDRGLIDSKEFGAPLGKITHTERLIGQILENFQNNDGNISYNEKASRIEVRNEKVVVYTNQQNIYESKLLVLATGSRAFNIQKSLGFETPDTYLGIYTHLYGSESLILDNFDFNYMFHINPNISKNGPFFFNVGKERVSAGYLGNSSESEGEVIDKLDRILRNYKYIQPNIQGLKWDKSEFITGNISKHPISQMSKDRVIVLGEAAGLVTAFFYEGLLSGLVSANIAFKVVNKLIEKDSNFSALELKEYDKKIHEKLLDKYYNNGDACEYIFYSTNSSAINTIWNTYIDLINDNQQLRRNIWEAYRMHDIENYDTSRDKWAGEKLYEKLPTLSKLSLGPRFLKALVKF